MEPEELRKLRIAHGLTPAELAGLLGTTCHDVLGWEAVKTNPYHTPIEPDIRRRILRQLAIFRERHKERDLAAVARTSAKRFSVQPLVPALIGTGIRPGRMTATLRVRLSVEPEAGLEPATYGLGNAPYGSLPSISAADKTKALLGRA